MLQPTTPIPPSLAPFADSNLDDRRHRPGNDPVALRAIRGRRVRARGVAAHSGQRVRRGRLPARGAVRSRCSPRRSTSSSRPSRSCGGACCSPARRDHASRSCSATLGASLFTRRIRRLESAAERIAAGDFDEAVVDHGSDELGQLARTFERMRLRLATLDRARGEFIANASHELRTPLFSLGGFLELLDDPDLDERDARGVPRPDARAGDPPDEARHRPARPLAPRRRPPRRGREPSTWPRSPRSWRSEFRPRAAAARAPARARRAGARRRRSATPSARCRSAASWSRTRWSTRRRGRPCALEAATDGGRAVLAVADDGPGIPAEAQRADLPALLPPRRARRRPAAGSGSRSRASSPR